MARFLFSSDRSVELFVDLTPSLAADLQPGDVIEGSYYGFWHMYVVEERLSAITVRVIHFGRNSLSEPNRVKRDDLELDFSQPGSYRLYVFQEADCREPEMVVEVAQRSLSDAGHSLISNNNTDFVLRCKLLPVAFDKYRNRFIAVRPSSSLLAKLW